MVTGGIRYSVKATCNNQTKNKIEITTFTSIMVWGTDRVSHNLCIERQRNIVRMRTVTMNSQEHG